MHPRERLAYSAVEGRRPLRLPDGLRLIVWPVLALEEWDLARPMARMVISPPQSQPMQPDIPNWTWHEYGMRVGFWRIKRMLDALKIAPTVTLNARVCETYPAVVGPASRRAGSSMRTATIRCRCTSLRIRKQ
jgi:allantoinase